MLNSIVVFCGSQSGTNPLYEQHAKQVGALIAKNHLTLIYGGGNRGLMGATANAVMELGGKVTGVMPHVLKNAEHQHDNITELIVVDDMHTRKKMLYELADCAIILPGGMGTMDELFEMATWNNLKIHDKQIFILNSAEFYNPLLAHMDAMQNGGFLYDNWRERFIICDTPDAIFSYLSKM